MVRVGSRTLVAAAVALATVSPVRSLQAQELSRLYAEPTPVTPQLELGDTVRKHARMYWLEGGLILGIATGLLGAVAAAGFCNDPDSGGGNQSCWDNALVGGAVGVAAGFSLGALVGGFIKKAERKDQETIGDESP